MIFRQNDASWLFSLVKQTIAPKKDFLARGGLTNLPSIARLDLSASNHVPDAGHPMRHQGKDGHQQGQHHGAVLRVAVQLLQQAEEAQQPHSLEEVDQRCLGRREDVRCLALNTAFEK